MTLSEALNKHIDEVRGVIVCQHGVIIHFGDDDQSLPIRELPSDEVVGFINENKIAVADISDVSQSEVLRLPWVTSTIPPRHPAKAEGYAVSPDNFATFSGYSQRVLDAGGRVANVCDSGPYVPFE